VTAGTYLFLTISLVTYHVVGKRFRRRASKRVEVTRRTTSREKKERRKK
jgi:hypothetical protein